MKSFRNKDKGGEKPSLDCVSRLGYTFIPYLPVPPPLAFSSSLSFSPAYSNASILLSSHPVVTEKDALTSCNEMGAYSANPLSGL